MNKKYLTIAFLSIFLIGIVSATDSISSSSFNINIYNGTIELKSSDYSGNNRNFTFDLEGLRNGSSAYQNFPYSFLFSTSGVTINVSSEFLQNYTSCLAQISSLTIDKNAFDLGWNDCRRQLGSLTNTQSNWTSCITELATTKADRDSKQTSIDTLNTDKKNTQNTSWLFGLGGLALGILGTCWKFGKLPMNKVKKADESFNQFQGR